MSPKKFLPLSIAVFTAASGFVQADTITLKSGEKLQGKIREETPEQVTMDVQVSASITDPQTISRDDIASVEKELPDEAAWQSSKDIAPGPNSVPLESYDAQMKPLEAFLSAYPESKHASEAASKLETLRAEKKRVAAGELRVGDRWLSKEEAGKERYQLGGKFAYEYMRRQLAAGDVTGALNTFDQLEKSYPGSQSFPDAVEAARGALAALKKLVGNAKAAYGPMQAEFQRGVNAASDAERPELLAARQREIAQGEAALAAAEKAGLKWAPLNRRSEKNITALATKIPTEISRLERFDVSRMRESIKLMEQAEKQLAAADPAAKESLKQAQQLWTTNEMVTRLQPEITALHVATPTPKPKATPTPRPTPSEQERAAEAAASKEKEKPFFMTLGGAITIVVFLAVLLAGVTVFKRLKGRANDVLE